MVCSNCGGDNAEARKFCGECGAPLARACAACGSANPAAVKFCGECGVSLEAASGLAPAGTSRRSPAPPPPAPLAAVAERRLVSVLFADLVGFTGWAEGRDPEEVRALLTRYFDESRGVIERYGGTVEKFIGDAVMAVWGTPVANEDDAERAVRAGLDLIDAVRDLGPAAGAPDLRARVGVMTGEAAITLGAEGHGMVAGDLVNAASRVQAAAEPGAVWVGDASHRATEAAVAYQDMGMHTLKGKSEPLRLWRALRVTAGRRGALRGEGLEAPFVGRDRELRTVKDVFHACAEDDIRTRAATAIRVFMVSLIARGISP